MIYVHILWRCKMWGNRQHHLVQVISEEGVGGECGNQGGRRRWEEAG